MCIILQIILSLNGGKFSFCSFLFMKIGSHCLILKGKKFFWILWIYEVKRADLHLYDIEEKSYCHHFGIYMETAYSNYKLPPPPLLIISTPPPPYTLQTLSLLLHFCRVVIITEQVKYGAESVFVSVSALGYG